MPVQQGEIEEKGKGYGEVDEMEQKYMKVYKEQDGDEQAVVQEVG